MAARSSARGRWSDWCRPQGVGEYAIARKGEFIRCPFHGWEFEIKTGQSYCAPDRLKIRSFDVAVQSGDQLVKGPYVAESYEVAGRRRLCRRDRLNEQKDVKGE